MRKIVALLDNLLDSITMYRLMLYGLGIVAGVAVVFGFTGTLPFTGVAMLASLAVLSTVCFVANTSLGILFDTPTNYESSLITLLILFCIFKPSSSLHDLLLLAVAGAIAMASKYVLAIKGKHIFNPAAIAAVVLGVTGLFPALWWIATPVMLPFVAILGLLVVRKIRRFKMVLSFTGAALIAMVVVGLSHQQAVGTTLVTAFTSWPLVFLGTIMLTEPSTNPVRLRHQLIYGVGVGILFASQLNLGILTSTPENVLILGNIYAYTVNPKYRLKLRLKQKIQLSAQVYDFIFTPNKPIAFKAGQYMEWTLGLPLISVDGRGNRRTFTLASSPTESDVHIGVKFYQPASSFKKALQAMQVGDSIVAGQLGGEFVLPEDSSQKLLFIAGGIGITPFRSMLTYLADKQEQRDVVLFYGAPSEAEISYQDVLKKAAQNGATIVPFFGKADATTLPHHVPDLAERRIYISGPHAMVVAYENMLSKAGIKRSQIVVDYFPGY